MRTVQDGVRRTATFLKIAASTEYKPFENLLVAFQKVRRNLGLANPEQSFSRPCGSGVELWSLWEAELGRWFSSVTDKGKRGKIIIIIIMNHAEDGSLITDIA